MYEKELLLIRQLYENGCYRMKFYADRIQSPSQLETYEDFCTLPFMYKDEIRRSTPYERTVAQASDVFGIFSSSGTTGDKTYYIYSKEDKRVHSEFVISYLTELGVTSEDLGAVCSPVGTGVMAQTMMWEFSTMGAGYVNCVEPSPENIANVVTDLPVTAVATRPDILSTVSYFPEYANKAKQSRVNKLLLGGGFLSEGRRQLLETTWNADAYNLFGMSEMFGPMAAECRCKNGLHYIDDYLMIEIIDPETLQPVKPGDAGVAVYTTLWNKGFPLIRYWTDDVMSVKYDICPCKSSYPRLFYHGRIGDSLEINGRRVFPTMLEDILFDYSLIYSYQAKQYDESIKLIIEKPDELIVPSDFYKRVEALFGVRTDILFVQVGEIKYSGVGKKFICMKL